MAKTNNAHAILFFNLYLVLSLIFIVSMADAKLFGSVFGSKGKPKQLRTPKVDCNQVYGIGQ
ncbi:hypothetical protein F8388_006874, partial [Cannabis sativa]